MKNFLLIKNGLTYLNQVDAEEEGSSPLQNLNLHRLHVRQLSQVNESRLMLSLVNDINCLM